MSFTDPRGPAVTVVRVDESRDGLLLLPPKLTLSCGHVAEAARHGGHRIGDPWRCIRCRRAQESAA